MAMTFAYEDLQQDHIHRVIVSWTSDNSGDAAATTKKLTGEILKGVTVPAAGGSAPTDDYDITITDDAGADVLGSCMDDLADRDTANTEEVYFLVSNMAGTDPGGIVPPIVNSTLTVTVANAGDTKGGTIYLYLRPRTRK